MMCEITVGEVIEVLGYYLRHLDSIQMRMEFSAVVLHALGIVAFVFAMIVSIYYFFKPSGFSRLFFLVGAVFCAVILVLGYREIVDEGIKYYPCLRRELIGEDRRVDTVVGYLYRYWVECYRGWRRSWRGKGEVEYVYIAGDSDSVYRRVYKLQLGFFCNVDTGYYFVLVPEGAWDKGLIMLDYRIPEDTIEALLEEGFE